MRGRSAFEKRADDTLPFFRCDCVLARELSASRKRNFRRRPTEGANRLAKIGGLKVISRSSVMGFKGEAAASEIGKSINVDSL
jgi:hypothetical protein